MELLDVVLELIFLQSNFFYFSLNFRVFPRLFNYILIILIILYYLGAAKNLGLMRVCEGFIGTFPSLNWDFSVVELGLFRR